MFDLHKTYQYNFPTTIRCGAGVIKELVHYLRNHALKRPLLVTDATVADLPFFVGITKELLKNGFHVEVYKDMHKNPVKSDVIKGGDRYHQTQSDCIVGIGGGVALDVSRAIALRVNHNRDLFDYDDLIGGDQFVTEEVPHFIT
ncbi:MAG: iron-containing alcohol dehydrogenase, partial [Flavobacteriales bacterium]